MALVGLLQGSTTQSKMSLSMGTLLYKIKGETEVRVKRIFCLMLDYDVVVKTKA